MKSGDRQDPTPLILIVLGAVIVAAWQTVSSLSLGQVLSTLGSLVPLALGVLGIASALAAAASLGQPHAANPERGGDRPRR